MKPVNDWLLVSKTGEDSGLYVPDVAGVQEYEDDNYRYWLKTQYLLKMPDGRLAIESKHIIAKEKKIAKNNDLFGMPLFGKNWFNVDTDNGPMYGQKLVSRNVPWCEECYDSSVIVCVIECGVYVDIYLV